MMTASVKPARAAFLFGSATLALAAGIGAPAFAQDGGVVEDVIITAERREQSLQDVPISATVLNADALARQGVDNVSDLQQVSPSIAINTFNRSTFINIRGVGIAQSAPTSSPGVAYYINGALVPHEQTIGGSFYDIGAVEILRGPQGTLSGQNSTGGAIYVRSRAPEIGGGLSGYLDQTVGDYALSRTVGAVNIPVSNNLAIRVAGIYDTRDSFSENVGSSSSDPGNLLYHGFRVHALFQPLEELEFNVSHEYFRSDNDYNAIKNRNDPDREPFRIREDARSFNLQTGYRTTVEARWDLFEEAQLRWLTSYQYSYNQDQADGDRTSSVPASPASPPQGARIGYALTRINTLINEANLISTGDGPFQWVIGAFWMQENIPVLLRRFNCALPARPVCDVPILPANSTTQTDADNISDSLFGQFSYAFTPQLELSVGARYSEDTQEYLRIVAPGGPGFGVANSDATTGRIALNYTPMDNLLLYASVARGYKAGGVNLVVTDGFFEPETNRVTELGFKTTVLDGRLRLNGSVFSSEYEDIQFAALVNGAPRTRNAAAAESSGGELEMQAVFGDLSFNAGVAYLSAEFSEPTTLQNTVTGLNEAVPVGRVLPFSPEWTASAGVQYDFHFGESVLTPRLQVSAMTDQVATPFPSIATRVDGRTVWDARLTYEANANWRLEGFVTNFLDERYIASQVQNSSSSDGGILYGAPRQVGARLVYSFGE
jgi:iron complex outermembrane recepter protein